MEINETEKKKTRVRQENPWLYPWRRKVDSQILRIRIALAIETMVLVVLSAIILTKL